MNIIYNIKAKYKKNKGFLILDVLVSMVVIMTILIPLLNIFIIVRENNEYHQITQEVHSFLDYQIEEILKEDFNIEHTNFIEEGFIRIELLKTPSEDPDIYKITGNVYYDDSLFTTIVLYKLRGDYND